MVPEQFLNRVITITAGRPFTGVSPRSGLRPGVYAGLCFGAISNHSVSPVYGAPDSLCRMHDAKPSS